jgi:hypothetical protein
VRKCEKFTPNLCLKKSGKKSVKKNYAEPQHKLLFTVS